MSFAREAVREIAQAGADRPHAAEIIEQEAGMRENLAILLAEAKKFDEAVPEMRRSQACWAKLKDPRFTLSLPRSRLTMMRMLFEQEKGPEMKEEAATLADGLDLLLDTPMSQSTAAKIAEYYA